MTCVLEYRGYQGEMAYTRSGILVGRVLGSNSPIRFCGYTVPGAVSAFHHCVDVIIEENEK